MLFDKKIFKILVFVILIALLAYSDADAKKRKRSKPKSYPPPSHFFVQDTLLADGIAYKRVFITMKGLKHDVHVLQADLKNEDSEIKIMKANENISELAKLHDIMRYYDSLDQVKVLGAVNANFWRAYSNLPIGPVIIDGEVVEISSYKEWSSIFLTDKGLPFIDNFKISGYVHKKLEGYEITNVNRRKDSNGVVVYNKYGGDVIPYISHKKINDIVNSNIENPENDVIYNDSTEQEFNYELLKDELLQAERASSIEFSLPKLAVEYLRSPALNKNIYCKVREICQKEIKMPENGCIISFGKNYSLSDLPKIGDTIMIRYNTNVSSKEQFTGAVCGTPRLVRNGVAAHEAIREGSKGRRFISHKLPRTAVGYNKQKSKIYIVAVKPDNAIERTSGVNLEQLAAIMKYLGCYNAMNLDGGGSTVMVIDGKNVLNTENPNSSRKISVGIGVSSGSYFNRLIP